MSFEMPFCTPWLHRVLIWVRVDVLSAWNHLPSDLSLQHNVSSAAQWMLVFLYTPFCVNSKECCSWETFFAIFNLYLHEFVRCTCGHMIRRGLICTYFIFIYFLNIYKIFINICIFFFCPHFYSLIVWMLKAHNEAFSHLNAPFLPLPFQACISMYCMVIIRSLLYVSSKYITLGSEAESCSLATQLTHTGDLISSPGLSPVLEKNRGKWGWHKRIYLL